MSFENHFSPYRPAAGASPEEAAKLAAAAEGEPLVWPREKPAPKASAEGALAAVAAGIATLPGEACRAADGGLAGVADAPRACHCSPAHRERVAGEIRAAFDAGFSGVCLERPDAALSLGLLGAGFCASCQAAFARALARDYGPHLEPFDYLAVAREASGAVGLGQLPFGRDFWRMRQVAFAEAMVGHTRVARDVARGQRPFRVVAQYDGLGPQQLSSARLVDAAIFPLPGSPTETGAGTFRLLRGAMGRRGCAAALPHLALDPLSRHCAVAAACGVDVTTLAPPDAAEAQALASIRRFSRAMADRRHAASAASPVAECALLYSTESDLWSGGAHRAALARAGEALAAIHLQAPVFLRVADVPAQATLVLAGATGLSPAESAAVLRRVESGGTALVLGEVGGVDEAGRPTRSPLPPGKPSGVKVGQGLVVCLPLPEENGPGDALGKAIGSLVGKGVRAVSAVGRSRLFCTLYENDEQLDVHLVNLGAEPARGVTLFLGLHVSGGAKRARFYAPDGREERIGMNPAGYSISTVLPSFPLYAILSVPR
jgi:hypothetical protein